MPERLPLQDESGLISVGTAIALLLVAAVVYVVLAVVNSDADHFGAVPVPGSAGVELDEGDVQVHYSQKTSEDMPFERPPTLQFTVRGNRGLPLKATARGDDPVESDGVTSELIGSVSVPGDGVYEVRVTGASPPASLEPRLTFGLSPVDAMAARAKDLWEWLLGPIGAGVLLLLVVLYAAPRIERRNRAKRIERENP